ncbi:MAG: hypothetical protein KJ944_17010 [Alphaproteobacteria bacterium]|nr:hypothetical protein [Alphaproteobacteria bacterium]MBU1563100.1 hypothetical protein [Alphaproteobacteria bacterium]MBU2304294.1 hypothetical protein [Alphaproteobacteria bacterium]MBU2368296.1 hypothetical protein [Alphaproteobacteria bacterium]
MNDIPKDIRARLPATIRNPGLLVGWSLEREHARLPIGFSFGNPWIEPWRVPLAMPSGHDDFRAIQLLDRIRKRRAESRQ